MTVFKGYLKGVWYKKGIVIQYMVIFLALGLLMMKMMGNNGEASFRQQKLNVVVVDKDGSVLSDAIRQYVDKNHELVKNPGGKKALQEALYYGVVDYIIQIPSGFQEKFTSGEQVEIPVTSLPGSQNAFYMSTELDNYLNMTRTYIEAGESMKAAVSKSLETAAVQVEVNISAENTGETGVTDMASFARFLPYVGIAILCYVIGATTREFRRPEIKRRLEAGAVSIFRRNMEQLLAVLVMGAGIFGIFILMLAALTPDEFFGGSLTGYYLINIFCMILVALALAFLTGVLNKNDGALNGMVNVLALGLCFLGGVFVPEYLFSGTLKTVAQFLPTYWYERVNTILGSHGALTDTLLQTIRNGYLIQIFAAAALTAVSLAVVKLQEQEK